MERAIKFVLAIFTFFAVCSATYAQENLITSVIVSKPQDGSGAYQLTIKSDKPVDYKTKADSNDSVYFDLKNSVTVDNIDTVYDNVSGIDGVVVQQLENNKVRIYVNGENTSSTKLVFKTQQVTGSSATNEVVINRPIREYRPTNDIEALAQEDANWDENSFNPEHLMDSFVSMFGQKSDMTLVICIALLTICAIVSKKVFSKIRFEQEPLIGLSSTYQKPLVQELSAPQHQEQLPVSVPRAFNPAPTARYQQKQSPNVPNRNIVKENYAMNAYEKAQRNPYVSQAPSNEQFAQYQKRVQKPQVQNQFAQRSQQAAPAAPKMQGANVDNIKFLESVTKIYEQSGRGDLAQGLRVSINKKKTAV